ncbi:MAG: GntR family transcriptional regulator [Thiolinea sp.]
MKTETEYDSEVLSSMEEDTDNGNRSLLIYRKLRERICLLEYPPGQRLSEAVLAAEFGVSRTPIRHVLSKLESEGLVVTRHGAGNFVTGIELDYLRELYQLRMELAPLIGRLAPRRPTPAWLIQAMELEQQCHAISRQDQPKTRFAQINMAFFELLMELVGNQPLRETLERLFYLSARMWPHLMNEAAVAEESRLFGCEIAETIRLLENGGLASLGHLRRAHVEMAMQRLLVGVPAREA